VVKDNFEFRSNRNGTRVITNTMAGFSAFKFYLENNNLAYFAIYPKFLKPIKAVIRHLPLNTPAEVISDGLVSLGFDVISVKQMTATRHSPPEGTTTINIPLFLITLPRTAKSQEIFILPSLCYIAIRVEHCKAKNGLTQCHNCQKFGHVWENCKQPPRCLWCGGGHMHKECPEKGSTSSTPACCNCQLAKEEKAHPANYRGCRYAKEEMQKRKSQRTPKTTSPPQVCPSRRRSEAGQSNSIGLRHAKWKWQVQPQWNRGSLCPYTNTNSMQGSPFGLQM
jgi:hypothetical protein